MKDCWSAGTIQLQECCEPSVSFIAPTYWVISKGPNNKPKRKKFVQTTCGLLRWHWGTSSVGEGGGGWVITASIMHYSSPPLLFTQSLCFYSNWNEHEKNRYEDDSASVNVRYVKCTFRIRIRMFDPTPFITLRSHRQSRRFCISTGLVNMHSSLLKLLKGPESTWSTAPLSYPVISL